MATRRIEELLRGGDWACSHRESMGLREVCRHLQRVGSPRVAARARFVAELSRLDMGRAIDEWQVLARALRNEELPVASSSG